MNAPRLRLYTAHWALGDRTGSFDVDAYPTENILAIATSYLRENYGTDATITSITEAAS